MQTTQLWLTIFVGVIALACAIQAVMNVALFLAVTRMVSRIDTTVSELRVQISPTLMRMQLLVDDISPRITGIAADASEMTRWPAARPRSLIAS